MSDTDLPKYARWEHERRCLVPADGPRPWEDGSGWVIRDRYLEAGRLRLRAITEPATGRRTFKLCKKFGSDATFSQPIVNV